MAVFTGNGSAGSPSITFSGDTNTGVFTGSADDTVRVANAGQEHVRVTADGDLQVFETDGDPTTGNVITLDASTGDVAMTSQNGGQLAGFRNQVMNGGFQVWQRGTSFTGSGTSEYMADRWYIFNANGRNISRLAASPKGVDGNSLLMTNNSATNVQFRQGIELPQAGMAGAFDIGTTWTFSFYSDLDWTGLGMGVLAFRDAGNMDVLAGQTPVTTDSTLFSEITADANTNDGINWRRFSFTFTVTGSPSSTHEMLEIGPSAPSGGLRFAGVQLEPGPVATPFENRPIGVELALCQRYFFKYPGPPDTGYSSTTNIGLGTSQNTTVGLFNSLSLLPQPLRSDPTVSFTGSPTLSEQVFNPTSSPATYMSWEKLGLAVGASPAPFLSAGKVCNLLLNNASILFDAEF